ncbi:MAG: enoyl-CoA hydratase/isomerase family protein [Halioglobus sp.]|nr:enoyl-CoA hydratase/isomerase family protein [Halioglobus sp.]
MQRLPVFDDISTRITGHVAVIEIQRPPHNFFDRVLIAQLADILEALDEDGACRSIVLASQGKSFCAGANFDDGSGQSIVSGAGSRHLYDEALRLFSTGKPVIGAIQGAAIGGGMGLALVPDFRVGCAKTRFSANFTLLGVHPGFGLTLTLPALVGQQKANLLLYTGRRIKGEEAFDMGLLDLFVADDQVLDAAISFAEEIACAAPLAVQATRATCRAGLVEKVKAAMAHEKAIQGELSLTGDFREGVAASAERRKPDFKGC